MDTRTRTSSVGLFGGSHPSSGHRPGAPYAECRAPQYALVRAGAVQPVRHAVSFLRHSTLARAKLCSEHSLTTQAERWEKRENTRWMGIWQPPLIASQLTIDAFGGVATGRSVKKKGQSPVVCCLILHPSLPSKSKNEDPTDQSRRLVPGTCLGTCEGIFAFNTPRTGSNPLTTLVPSELLPSKHKA